MLVEYFVPPKEAKSVYYWEINTYVGAKKHWANQGAIKAKLRELLVTRLNVVYANSQNRRLE